LKCAFQTLGVSELIPIPIECLVRGVACFEYPRFINLNILFNQRPENK
jgi:hypothetical protein